MSLPRLLVFVLCLSLLAPAAGMAHSDAAGDQSQAGAGTISGGCHEHAAATPAHEADASADADADADPSGPASPPDCCGDDCSCGCLPATGCAGIAYEGVAIAFAAAQAAIEHAPAPIGALPPPLRPPIA